MQSVDYTTLVAICAELQDQFIPARVEQVYQRDRHTLFIALRTLQGRDWLTLSWHPQAARLHIGSPPPRIPDTFTLSDQLRHQLKGLALTTVILTQPWERVVDLKFARRPGEAPLWHLYMEIMGKYSNLILTDANQQIVTTAHQVRSHQSTVRTIETGQPYSPPPSPPGYLPRVDEAFESWRDRLALIPGQLDKQLYQTYRGVSPVVARTLSQLAQLQPRQTTDTLTPEDWQQLWQQWQGWLNRLETATFTAGFTPSGYSVLSDVTNNTSPTMQELLNRYYTQQWNQQQFGQLHHQLSQQVRNQLKKLRQKAKGFHKRLAQSEEAETYRAQADLLMAYLHQWQPGLQQMVLADFETGAPCTIPLNPEKNAVQNAQVLYKKHQKLKRSRAAIQPLLDATQAEIDYLEQVESDLLQAATYEQPDDLSTLEEIREELIQQGYGKSDRARRSDLKTETQPRCYQTPSGFELWVGRNNRQNDRLTFRTANEYDLWFHTQEIAGSHVLLRLEPGAVPDAQDLQFAANFAAYYSRGRQSDQVPVVYTRPKFVYKPKGAKPGVAIYKREQIIWGRSQQAADFLHGQAANPR
ncbi:MAG: fibronectin-binding domain-containing protein [Spirulina sp. SIO3F2]|nr:fibronectin-binding domain-containing protein [Spirulina sp. SIO3F2]